MIFDMNRDTLLIRHLPTNLTDQEKEELLKHFGVLEIKCLSGRKKKSNVVFARFESDAAASVALRRLHQLDVMGYPLTVEFARKKESSIHLRSDARPTPLVAEDAKGNGLEYHEAFMQRLNSWNAPLNFCQPPPPHLNYLYPPPSRAVLSNISKALASVPKFYTQVLHLMNKMNLPSPFETTFCSAKSLDEELLPSEQQQQAEVEMEVEERSSTEDESEMESEPEGHKPANVIPTKRSKPQTKRPVKKRKFVRPETHVASTKTALRPEQVFEQVVGPDAQTQRRIELNIPGRTPGEGGTAETPEEGGGFGVLFPPAESREEGREEGEGKEDDDREDPAAGSTITSEQLAANRIPSRDQKHLPVFKNYQPGIPSCRLYIKNLSKHVVERDLHFIYRKYLIPDYEEQGSMFDVRLMKEGRMKGQAFVTLQNTKQAQRALIETNGFILKDKPLVVQFARSAKAK